MDDRRHHVAALPRRRHRLVRRLQGAQQPVARRRAGRDARDHRPQRRRQDHDDGRRHRQDPARRPATCSSTATPDLTKLDETEIAELGIGRKFQKPTVFEMHTVEDNILLALKSDRSVRARRCSGGQRRRPTAASTAFWRSCGLQPVRERDRRQPVARPEAMARDRHAAGAGAEAAAGRRAGRRHDRRRDASRPPSC